MKNETPLEPLLKQISSAVPVTRALQESLSGFTNIRYYPQDFILIKAGEVVRGLTVMLKGVAHASGKESGNDTSYWFATESHLLTPAVKNGRDIIAAHDVTVLEDSFIAFITYADISRMVQEMPDFARAVQSMQVKYNNNISFREGIKKQDSTQKLRSLKEQHPGLEHRASPMRITNYLDITPEEFKLLTML